MGKYALTLKEKKELKTEFDKKMGSEDDWETWLPGSLDFDLKERIEEVVDNMLLKLKRGPGEGLNKEKQRQFYKHTLNFLWYALRLSPRKDLINIDLDAITGWRN